MKKNKVISWLLVLASFGIVLFIGSHLLHIGGWGHRNMMAMQNGGSQMQAFGFHRGGFHRGFGGPGQFGGMHGMRNFGGIRGVGIFGSLASIIFALILAAVGWFLRKKAKGSLLMKWGGSLLILIGTLLVIRRVLPLALLIILGVVIWKFVVKGNRKQSVNFAADDSFHAIQAPVSSKTGNMLDEWERNISKEEQ